MAQCFPPYARAHNPVITAMNVCPQMCLSCFTPFLGRITREKCLSLGWTLTFWYDPFCHPQIFGMIVFCNHYQKSVFSPQFIRIVSKKSEDGLFPCGSFTTLTMCADTPSFLFTFYFFLFKQNVYQKRSLSQSAETRKLSLLLVS